jgi:hypothetical protein
VHLGSTTSISWLLRDPVRVPKTCPTHSSRSYIQQMGREPQRQKVAKAIEYWVIAALVAGSMVYGAFLGVRDLIRLMWA